MATNPDDLNIPVAPEAIIEELKATVTTLVHEKAALTASVRQHRVQIANSIDQLLGAQQQIAVLQGRVQELEATDEDVKGDDADPVDGDAEATE